MTNHLRSVASKALRCIRSGDRLQDKASIGFLLSLYPLLPVGAAARNVGLRLPDPGRLIRSYRCRTDYGLIECPGGPPFFLQAAGHDPGVASAVAALSEGTFVDVGANVGFLSIRAGLNLRGLGRVVAFEPHPVRFRFLKHNVVANRLANVICLQIAVGSHDATSAIYDLDKSFGPHTEDVSLHGGRNRDAIPVLVRSLDSICSELGISDLKLVKIDVEGHEAEVLKGMSRVIRESRPIIVFEALSAEKLRESANVLNPAEYTIEQVDGGNYLATP